MVIDNQMKRRQDLIKSSHLLPFPLLNLNLSLRPSSTVSSCGGIMAILCDKYLEQKPLPSYGENGQCTQKKYISLSPLLAQCRSEMLFFFSLPYTPSLRVCMERRRKKHSHSCTVPGVGRGKCIFSGRIVRFLHMGVLSFFYNELKRSELK